MAQFKHGNYVLRMKDTGKQDRDGKHIVAYTLSDSAGIIFQGSDLHVSPLHAPLSKASAGALLGFLTLQKGDTDTEYFDNYTPRQLAFARNEAEDLYFWREQLEGTN